MIAGVSDAGFQQLRRHEVTPSRLHSEQLRLIPKTSVTPKLLVLLSRSFIGEAAEVVP
jgi:hypothetical protein